MRIWAEIAMCGVLALGAHAMLAGVALRDQGAADGAGASGADTITLTALDGAFADVVADWTVAPQAQTEPIISEMQMPGAAPAAAVVNLAPPAGRDAPPVLPQPAALIAPPKGGEPGPEVSHTAPPTPPKAPPEPVVPAKRAMSSPPPRAEEVARGIGLEESAAGSGIAGRATAAQDRDATGSLTAEWGARIRHHIEARKRPPSGFRGSGRAVVRISVTRDGRVAAMSIVASSGAQPLDRAALNTVRRSGRLPAAPAGLSRASATFDLPISFNR